MSPSGNVYKFTKPKKLLLGQLCCNKRRSLRKVLANSCKSCLTPAGLATLATLFVAAEVSPRCFVCIHFIYICLVFKAQSAARCSLLALQRQLPQWLATCHAAFSCHMPHARPRQRRRPHGQPATRQEFHYLHLLCNFPETFSIIHFVNF